LTLGFSPSSSVQREPRHPARKTALKFDPDQTVAREVAGTLDWCVLAFYKICLPELARIVAATSSIMGTIGARDVGFPATRTMRSEISGNRWWRLAARRLGDTRPIRRVDEN